MFGINGKKEISECSGCKQKKNDMKIQTNVKQPHIPPALHNTLCNISLDAQKGVLHPLVLYIVCKQPKGRERGERNEMR